MVIFVVEEVVVGLGIVLCCDFGGRVFFGENGRMFWYVFKGMC